MTEIARTEARSSVAIVAIGGDHANSTTEDIMIHLSISYFFVIPISAALTKSAWYCVGGRSSTHAHVIYWIYVVSVMAVLFLLLFMVLAGIEKFLFRDLREQIIDAMKRDDDQRLLEIFKEPRFKVMMLIEAPIAVLGIIYLSVWFYLSWGFLRVINCLSRLRSFTAFVLFVILSIPATVLAIFLSAAM
jgi:hypothetical protein